ncbi:MAG TPA: class I SAM-dependent methyltransferase [Acidimicrobiia bacterium]|nr:class I SAM-dependent methyltransferase [Acidimicrobiia bacterium]
MANCCDPSGYRKVFNSKEARHAARSYRRKGLDSTARPMVDALRERGVAGATVLEVGAGVGGAQIELMKAGAASGVAYDLSPAHERIGHELLAEHEMAGRVVWRTADFVADPEAPAADLVFLNRVVCCYPDMPGMVDSASTRARRLLAMSYPRDRWWVRFGIRTINGFLRLMRNSFRVFVHPTDEIARRAVATGLSEIASGRTFLWEWHVWERRAA